MRLNLERVRANVQQASTEDLLNRATVYRAGMEEEALVLIDEELRRRGVSAAAVADHEVEQRQRVLRDAGDVAQKCSQCRRPAVGAYWGWHWLWGLVPLFPRKVRYCAEHEPGG
jgi:hypothetical protein